GSAREPDRARAPRPRRRPLLPRLPAALSAAPGYPPRPPDLRPRPYRVDLLVRRAALRRGRDLVGGGGRGAAPGGDRIGSESPSGPGDAQPGPERRDWGLRRCDLVRSRSNLGWNRCDLGWNRSDRGWSRCDLGWSRCDLGWNRCDLGWSRRDLSRGRRDLGWSRSNRGRNRCDLGRKGRDLGPRHRDFGERPGPQVRIRATPMANVFVSYSHLDEVWKDRLLRHFRALERQGLAVEAWHDREIPGGGDWEAQIRAAMAAADAAVLLISTDFLASEFINSVEVPFLLDRLEKGSLPVIPVVVSPCNWKLVAWLKKLNLRPPDGTPLSKLRKPAAEEQLTAITDEVFQLATSRGAVVPPPHEKAPTRAAWRLVHPYGMPKN